MNDLVFIDKLTLCMYLFFGWLLIAYSIIVFKQRKVNFERRSAVSGLFFFFGGAFCFAAGRIITGGAELYMYLILIFCSFVIYFATKQVILIYRLNKSLCDKEKEDSDV